MNDDSVEIALRALIVPIVRSEIEAALADAKRFDEYLSTAAAARVADVAPITIRRWIDAGALTEHRAGRELRVSRLELERVLRGNPAAGSYESIESPEEMADRIWGAGGEKPRARSR